MEDCILQPREVVLHYGVLPPSVFAPQLDCVGSVQAAQRGLAAVASTSSDGSKYVTCEDAASVLDMPVEQCQLLLDMIPAVSSKASSPAGGVNLYDLSLLLMAQLYKREAQKPETQDHWPEPASCSGGQGDAVKGGTKAAQPGSPGGASNSRMLIKNQIQQQQRQQQACSRGYAEFLHKHQIALLELVMDDSSTAQAWQQQRAAQRQQQKAVQLQLHEHQPQLQQQQSMQMQPTTQQDIQQPAATPAAGDSEMTPVEETAAAAAGEEAQESMQSSPVRQSSEDGNPQQQQQQQQQQLQPTGSLARSSSCSSTSSSSVPPVSVTAVEFDRLGFLLEVVNPKSSAGPGSGGLAAAFAAAAAAGTGSPASATTSSSSSGLSHNVPGYSSSSSLMMEELVAWMNSTWVLQQQKPTAVAALTAGSGPIAAAPAAAAAADLGSSPPAETIMGSSPPSTSAAAAATMNGLLSAINTGTAAAAATSPITPSASSSAAAAGGPVGLSSIRTSSARGVVAVAGGAVDERGVSGVYRGTVVRGPNDVTREEITIQNCIECNIYILAPIKLARIYNCSDCSVCIGAVGSLLRVECCERLQLTAAAGQVVVVSCHSCCLHLGTPRQPALLGDCRFIKLAPYNTRYETLMEHIAAAGIPTGVPSLWDQPLVISCNSSASSNGSGGSRSDGGGSSSGGGGTAAQLQQQRRPGSSTPSSPHTHGSSGGSSERRGGGGGGGAKAVVMMQPEDFLPLVVPFRGTSGPLAGGSAHAASTQWVPRSHQQQQGPLPPLPFTLPPAFDAALQQHYHVVTELRNRIRGSGLDEGRRNQLQGVIQSYFREWLHSSGQIRQVYDLSKLEGDELGPSGGSPPAALRDHSHL